MVGGTALFVLALGMGVPLLIIGASAGLFLFKAGAWMVAVKDLFRCPAPGPGPLPGESLHLPYPADVPLGRPADYLFDLPSGLGPTAGRDPGLGPIPEGSGDPYFSDRSGAADRGLGRWKKSLSTLGGASGKGDGGIPLTGTTTPSGLNFQRLTSPVELEQQLQSGAGPEGPALFRGRMVHLLQGHGAWRFSGSPGSGTVERGKNP